MITATATLTIVARQVNRIRSFATAQHERGFRKSLRRGSTAGMATMLRPLRPRRFAPLDPAKKSAVDGSRGDGVRVLKGVVFDVDGTLCEFSFRVMLLQLTFLS
ncbi:hypothetical protein BDV95DRAFT_280201 [Massariosphaeria phaeospora]|uniref:HAD-like domain-containing protein n=1 Tax=Massariosphaeria phaeospora TaxID=100035 RepID=A0A7C8MS78_9PLEO|nr:hypothetical protein BDV95DRAFT_280201 [Massariosphaeria phaeospora]